MIEDGDSATNKRGLFQADLLERPEASIAFLQFCRLQTAFLSSSLLVGRTFDHTWNTERYEPRFSPRGEFIGIRYRNLLRTKIFHNNFARPFYSLRGMENFQYFSKVMTPLLPDSLSHRFNIPSPQAAMTWYQRRLGDW